MNILHIVRTFDLSGRSRMIRDLCVGLAGECESTVACLTGPVSFRPAGVEVTGLNLSGSGFSFHGMMDVARLAGRLQAQVLHSHGRGAAVYAAGARLLHRRARLVHTVHRADGDLTSERSIVRDTTCRAMDRVVAVSGGAADAFCRANKHPRDEVAVVYNGVDLARFRSANHKSTIGNRKSPALVSVANLSPDKDFDVLLEALRIVREKLPVRLVVVGDGPERQRVEQLVRDSGLDEAVELLGRRDDVPAILAAADVFVHAARTEGLGIAVLEAMAARVPVVATAVGGLTEIVEPEKTGLLVEPGDAPAFAKAALRLLDSRPLRESLAERACARVEEEFSIERMCGSYATIYRGLCGGLQSC